MQGARAFVQHSVVAGDGDSEGTPVAVMEAGASALPVIATRHAGIANVIVDGETGYLVDEHDVPAMAQRMELLLREPELAKRLGYAGRRRIESEFSMDVSIGRFWAVIENVVSGGAAGGGCLKSHRAEEARKLDA